MEAKKFWESKTFWLNVFIILGGIAEYLAGLPASVSAATVIAGVLGVIIRFLTKQPVK